MESGKAFIFLSNNFELAAPDIAKVYKHRWLIEQFCKWIKQHLKVKSSSGQSENAVKIQIWIAICVYTLLAIVKKKFLISQIL